MTYNEDWKNTPGPWQNEPDKERWVDANTQLDCFAWRNHSGAWCGYVKLPESHPLHGVEYCAEVPEGLQHAATEVLNGTAGKRGPISIFCMIGRGPVAGDLFDVHGSVTFSGEREGEGFWYGFDCGHIDDLVPSMPEHIREGEYRTLEYVRAECASLAKQLLALMPKQLTHKEQQ